MWKWFKYPFADLDLLFEGTICGIEGIERTEIQKLGEFGLIQSDTKRLQKKQPSSF